MSRCLALLGTCLALFIAGCGTSRPAEEKDPPPLPTGESSRKRPAAADVDESDAFLVKFETTKGDFTVKVVPGWAPEGAKRFKELVEAGIYDNAKFFRVLPGFMVQFGIPGDPEVARQWKDKTIKDDPPFVKSNQPGFITFATSGKNSRTSQVFVNYGDNSRLDSQGFTPFGQVIDDGMKVVKKIESKHGEEPDQGQIQSRGNKYLDATYPELDYIKSAKIVQPGGDATPPETKSEGETKKESPDPKKDE